MGEISVPKGDSATAGLVLRVFTPRLRLLWCALVIFTVITEVIPLPLLPPIPFYSYKIMKLLCFVAVGYLAPLAFWRFNALNRGILLAAVSAVLVESLQGSIRSGHAFHWYEVLIKLALILFGFAVALDGRYEQKISVGRLRIRLVGEHVDPRLLVR